MSRASPWPVALTKERRAPSLGKADHFLSRIVKLIDWRPLEGALGVIPITRATRPRYRSLLLFKIVLLQHWYGLSDPGAEYAVNDRKDFARFVGLPEGAPCPSYSTINRFRMDLARRDLADPLLETVRMQLLEKGLTLHEGAMAEPSLIPLRNARH